MGVPADVGESLVPHNVLVDTVTDRVGYLDTWMATFLQLSHDQLQEVVAVYNAWRVGNLQDCTIHVPGDVKL